MELKLEGKIQKIGQEEQIKALTKKSMLLTTNWKIAEMLGEVSNKEQNPSRQPVDTTDLPF